MHFFVRSIIQTLYSYIKRRYICDVEAFLFWVTFHLVVRWDRSLQDMELYLTIPEKLVEDGALQLRTWRAFVVSLFRERKAWSCLQSFLVLLGWGLLDLRVVIQKARASSAGGSFVLTEPQEGESLGCLVCLWVLGQLLWYIWTPFWFVVSVKWHKTSDFSYVEN